MLNIADVVVCGIILSMISFVSRNLIRVSIVGLFTSEFPNSFSLLDYSHGLKVFTPEAKISRRTTQLVNCKTNKLALLVL